MNYKTKIMKPESDEDREDKELDILLEKVEQLKKELEEKHEEDR